MTFADIKQGGKKYALTMKTDLKPIISLLVLSFLLLSCGSKKKTVERTKISDTLIKTSITYKTAPIDSNYTIELECDTITGKIKPVDFSETSGKNKAQVKIENNKLSALIEVGETTNKTDTIYKTKFKDVFKTKEVVRHKTTLWMWLVIIAQALIIFILARRFI